LHSLREGLQGKFSPIRLESLTRASVVRQSQAASGAWNRHMEVVIRFGALTKTKAV
jgi:hypothetical protein